MRIGTSCGATGCIGGLAVLIIFAADAPTEALTRACPFGLPTGSRADFDAVFPAVRVTFALFLPGRRAVLVDRPAAFAECLLIKFNIAAIVVCGQSFLGQKISIFNKLDCVW